MQLVMVLIIVILALTLTLIAFFFGRRDFFLGLPLTAFAIILWFTASFATTSIDQPYTVAYDNNGTVVVEHGIREVTVNAPLSYVFFGMAMICLVYLGYILFRSETPGEGTSVKWGDVGGPAR